MKAFASRRIISVLVLTILVLTSACGASADDDTQSTEAPTTSVTQSTEAPTTSVTQPSSGVTETCEEYSDTVMEILASSSDSLTLTAELFDLLGDADMLLALYLDTETVDTLIDTLDGFSDEFGAYQRILPTAPTAWAETDRHFRIALSGYESVYSDIATGFREFKNADIEKATSIFVTAAADIDDVSAVIDLATAAIPPGGC